MSERTLKLIAESPHCVLEYSDDLNEIMTHSELNCIRCWDENIRKLHNNQEVLFRDTKPFWVLDREKKLRDEKEDAEEKDKQNKNERMEQVKIKKKLEKMGKLSKKEKDLTKQKIPMNVKISQLRKMSGISKIEAKQQILRKRKSENDKETTRASVPKNQMPWTPMNFRYGSRKSTLTFDLHRRYIAIKMSMKNSGETRHKGNTAEIKQIDEILTNERAEFNKLVTNILTATNEHKNHNYCPHFAVKLLYERTMDRLNETNGIYSKNPIKQIEFSKISEPNGANWPRMDSLLLETGKVKPIKMPNLNRLAHIDMTRNTHFKLPITVDRDATASKLARKHGAKFVMTSSTARLIFIREPFFHSKNYEIPFQVRREFVQGRLESVVYFGKPLPISERNSMQIWWKFVNSAVKQNLYDKDDDSEKHEIRTETKEDDIFGNCSLDTSIMENFESFGANSGKSVEPKTNYESKVKIPKRKTVVQARAAKRARICGNSTDDNNDEKYLKMADSEAVNENEEDMISDFKTKDIVGNILGNMGKVSSKTDGEQEQCELDHFAALECSENMAEYDNFPEMSAFRYSVFKLNDQFNSLLLIRSNLRGILDGKRISIGAKIEYFPQHGGETINNSEWLWNWAGATFKSAQEHLLVHVHFKKQQCLQISNVNFEMDNISHKNQTIINSCWNNMSHLLNEIYQLPVGDYLLRRNSDQESISVLEKVDESAKIDCENCIDLKELRSITEMWKKVGRLPKFEERFFGIDPNKMLVWHKVKSRIPATFWPRKDDEKPKLTDAKKQGRKRNKNAKESK